MKVRAKDAGFYGGFRRKAGDEFTIDNPSQFSVKWMEKAELPYVKLEPIKMPETFSELVAQTDMADKKLRKKDM